MAESRQIFVFDLDKEQYGIDIENVREIIVSEEKEITDVPNVPDFITGITNVRGKVVPVIDLEKKLSLEPHDSSYIVIVELNDTPAGVLVDDVEEVMKLDESKIQDAPEILEQEIHRDYIKDVVVLEDSMIVILDLVAGLEEHEEVAVEQVKDTMETDSGDEEKEQVTQQDAERAAAERVSKDEETREEKDTEESGDDSGKEGESGEEEKEEDENKNQQETREEETDEDGGEVEKDTGDSVDEDSEEEDDPGSSGEFECDECGDGFDSKRELASHKVQEH